MAKELFTDKIIRFLDKLAWHFGIPPSENSPLFKENNKLQNRNKKGRKSSNNLRKKTKNQTVKRDKKEDLSKENAKKVKATKSKKIEDKVEDKDKTIETKKEKDSDKRESKKSVNYNRIERLLDNDTSLINIATVKELQSLDLNRMNVPTLLPENLTVFDKDLFEVDNFIHLYLYMIVNKKQEYTLYYNHRNFTGDERSYLLRVLIDAYNKARALFVEYFSSLEFTYKTKSVAGKQNGIYNGLEITIILKDSYPNAFDDTFKMLKLCRYVKTELVNKKKINKNMSQYDIAKVLFNWTALHTDYDHNKANRENKKAYSGYSAIAKGKAVCQGYTAMYNALCRCCGIEVYGMLGISANRITGGYEHHIWTLAKLNNKDVFIDSTWGTPAFENEEFLRKVGFKTELCCEFKWFDTPYQDFVERHNWDKEMYPI